MENNETLAYNGITDLRFGNHPSDFDKIHQLSVLLTDMDCDTWTRAHFCLYASIYPGGTAWGDVLRELFDRFVKGDREGFIVGIENARERIRSKEIM